MDDADDQTDGETDGEGDRGLTPGDSSPGDPADHAAEAARKRRLARVFGDVLPEATQDERSAAWGDREGGTDDDWFRRQVPPHHG